MNNQEIFTPEERDENEDRKRELIELVASGEAILIVGAGSSARVGYVTWNGLLEALEDLANRCGTGLDQTQKGDELAYAADIKIILSIEDYYRAYGLRLITNHVQRDSEWTLHRKLLWAVLATRRVVFIGFSMKDPYFRKMLETVSADLWRWDKSIHFAIMSISSTNGTIKKTPQISGKLSGTFFQTINPYICVLLLV